MLNTQTGRDLACDSAGTAVRGVLVAGREPPLRVVLMSRDIPPLPWSDPYRLWYAAALMAGAITASAVVGIVSAIRGWPETFTTDPAGEKPA